MARKGQISKIQMSFYFDGGNEDSKKGGFYYMYNNGRAYKRADSGTTKRISTERFMTVLHAKRNY